jgi:hypothetical protein
MDNTKRIKKNITGASPQEIADMLLIYKDGVSVPLHHFLDIMKCMPKNQHHLFAVAVKNDTVYIEYAESKKRL